MKTLVILFFLLKLTSAFAYDNFVCQCLATGPGADNACWEKICSYDCNCTGLDNKGVTSGIKIKVNEVKSTAQSKDDWDRGSLICHGQYAYKANLSDPNWKTQVKFSPFVILKDSSVYYEEKDQSVEIAIGVNLTIGRSKKAPEIAEILNKKLN